MSDGSYHTGALAQRDEDGYITYVGRTDDVFKASDYVPATDQVRLAVPEAYVAHLGGLPAGRSGHEHLGSEPAVRP